MQHAVEKGRYRLIKWSIVKCKLLEVLFVRYSSARIEFQSIPEPAEMTYKKQPEPFLNCSKKIKQMTVVW